MKSIQYATNPTQDQSGTASDHDLASINQAVEMYNHQMVHHPLGRVLAAPSVSRKLLTEYAGIQYIDSVLWVPMLALMKDRVTSPRLKRALTENILCEAGAKHTSHITLCMQFLQSVGVSPYYGNFQHFSELAQHPVEMMNAVSGMSEAQIAGWALVAEAIVPALFQMAVPAFEKIEGVDMTYLKEHITVDSDEHAEWMREGVADLLRQGTPANEILVGVHLGGRTALSIPDALFAKSLRGAYDPAFSKGE